jgi:hypothetical protein
MELLHPVGNNRRERLGDSHGEGQGSDACRHAGRLPAVSGFALGLQPIRPRPATSSWWGSPPAKAEEAGNTLEAATRACTEETDKKGIKSITAIFSRLRPGQAEPDYIACMRACGYEVSQ